MFFYPYLAVAVVSLSPAVRGTPNHVVVRASTTSNASVPEQTCLDSTVIQSASNRSGQEKGTVGINPGQAESET